MNTNTYVSIHAPGTGGTTLKIIYRGTGGTTLEITMLDSKISLQHLRLPQKCTQCHSITMSATGQAPYLTAFMAMFCSSPSTKFLECLALSNSASPLHLLPCNSRAWEEKLLPPKDARKVMSNSSYCIFFVSVNLANS